MNSTVVIILIAIAVLLLAFIAFLIIRRRRYIHSLRQRGWTFESKPALESVLDHHAPPFGLGFVRKVDEAVSGTTAAGVQFRVFEYASSEGGPRFDDRVASMHAGQRAQNGRCVEKSGCQIRVAPRCRRRRAGPR